MARRANGGKVGGFTHAVRIDYDDLIANVLSTDAKQSFKYYIPIPAGAIVKDVCLHVDENFTGTGLTSLVAYVGDNSAYGFLRLTPANFLGDSTSLPGTTYYNSGSYLTGTDSESGTTVNVLNGKVYQTASAIGMLCVGNVNISNLSTGVCTLCANILDPASYF